MAKRKKAKPNPKVKVEIVDQQVEPRCALGIDHEGEGKVLIRHGDRRLVWRKPRSVWSGRFMPRSYCPAQLEVVNPKVDKDKEWTAFGGRLKALHEGGRFSVVLLVAHYSKILRLLDLSVRELPLHLLKHTKKTIVITTGKGQ